MNELNKKAIPIILDTDIGTDLDDTWALGFILQCPEFDIKLITTTSDNTIERAKIVAKFLERVNRTDIPIGIGPIESQKKVKQHGWIKDYDLSEYPGIIYENGIESLCRTILQSLEPITLIAIGPLGNIASAIKIQPDIVKNARFVGMQGSIRIGYEGRAGPHPEFNVIRNIQACKKVFKSPWEKTITPLDTCGNIVLSDERFERVMNCDNVIMELIKENFTIWAEKTRMTKKTIELRKTSILFDTVAIYLGLSEEFLNMEELKIIVTDKGITQINENGDLIRCATSWKDLEGYKDLLVNRLISNN
ncbi:MAG: nucleoside hydrolase [Promethearchaeota archaeon]